MRVSPTAVLLLAVFALVAPPVCLAAARLVGGLIVFQHRSNIQRLIQGNENKFSLHKKAK